MIRPQRAFIIFGTTRLASRQVAVRLVAMTSVEVVLGHAHEQPVAGDAGVGDQHLDRPELLLDLATAASTWSGSVTSHFTVRSPARRPAWTTR